MLITTIRSIINTSLVRRVLEHVEGADHGATDLVILQCNVYIYIYTYRERDAYIYIYIYMHIYIYV